jgi:uncharacterized membrane protein (Fun14 family)
MKIVIAYLQLNHGAESRIMSIIESLGTTAATIGGGFFVGVLIGYAMKKVINMVVVIVGSFLAGLDYLQYYGMASINLNKLQTVSEGAITTLSNAVMQIPGMIVSSDDSSHAAATESFAMTSFGIPLPVGVIMLNLILFSHVLAAYAAKEQTDTELEDEDTKEELGTSETNPTKEDDIAKQEEEDKEESNDDTKERELEDNILIDEDDDISSSDAIPFELPFDDIIPFP